MNEMKSFVYRIEKSFVKLIYTIVVPALELIELKNRFN